MHTTRVSAHVAAPRQAVYRALLDPAAVAAWRVPDGMRCEVHHFEARVGGSFRVSLTYDAPDRVGKSAARTDTYHGHFADLEPDERVVEVIEFETADEAQLGTMTMTMTTTLTEVAGGTDILVVHEGIPAGLSPADNETGTRMALTNLARLVEGQSGL